MDVRRKDILTSYVKYKFKHVSVYSIVYNVQLHIKVLNFEVKAGIWGTLRKKKTGHVKGMKYKQFLISKIEGRIE